MRGIPVLVAVCALAAAGCGGGSDSAAPPAPPPPPPAPTTTAEAPPEPTGPLYTIADLSKLALQPKDAPRGMRYATAESGRKSLAEAGFLVPRQVSEIKSYGFKALYDAFFDSTTSDLRVASRLWLFEEVAGASGWVRKTKNDSIALSFEPIRAPALGEESWAAKGIASGSEAITYVFRLRNVVIVVASSTQQTRLSPNAALAAAQAALKRARLV